MKLKGWGGGCTRGNTRSSFFALALLLTLPAAAAAQDARSLLADVAKAMGAENLKALHYTGSGSSYIVTPGPAPAGGWAHAVMKSYVRDINLEATTSRLQLVRTEGTPPTDQTISQVIDANSPWSTQYEFWLTPYGFLKGAMAHNATVETRTVFGTTYKVVSFGLSGNHRVAGYINDKNLVEKVETWIGDKGDVLVETHYRDYMDFGALKVPTIITQNEGGALSLILIVKEAKAS